MLWISCKFKRSHVSSTGSSFYPDPLENQRFCVCLLSLGQEREAKEVVPMALLQDSKFAHGFKNIGNPLWQRITLGLEGWWQRRVCFKEALCLTLRILKIWKPSLPPRSELSLSEHSYYSKLYTIQKECVYGQGEGGIHCDPVPREQSLDLV